MSAAAARRLDVAVVLARGDSRRMGFAKGLARLPGDERTLAERIADLYLGFGWPVLLIARRGTGAAYRRALAGRAGVRVAVAAGGGDTAGTLAAAAGHLPPACSHVWAHPVDLPLVAAATVAALAARSAAAPTAVLRPVHGDVPGHPVVLPVSLVRALATGEQPPAGPMRDRLDGGWTAVPTDDAGVVRDFDGPAALAAPALPPAEG